MELNKIYNESNLETMAKMPDCFVDLTLTSPPYDGLRNYNGQELSGLDGGVIKYPDTIDENVNYAVYTVLHSDVDSTSQGTLSESPLVSIILVDATDTATKTAIQTALNPYFKTIPFASFEGETTAAGVVIA